MTVVSRILYRSATNGMSTTDCCRQRPCVFSVLVDIINKDLLKAIFAISSMAAMFGIRHSTGVPTAFLSCLSAEPKAVAELLSERSRFKWLLLIV